VLVISVVNQHDFGGRQQFPQPVGPQPRGNRVKRLAAHDHHHPLTAGKRRFNQEPVPAMWREEFSNHHAKTKIKGPIHPRSSFLHLVQPIPHSTRNPV
jgi:hypothetical protein